MSLSVFYDYESMLFLFKLSYKDVVLSYDNEILQITNGVKYRYQNNQITLNRDLLVNLLKVGQKSIMCQMP